MQDRYSVVYPLGVPATREQSVAPSLPDLNGKTIGQLWNYSFRGEETFPLIEQALRERYPDVRFVRYDQLGNFHDPSREEERMAALPGRLQALGCDAVIVGNGC